MFENCFVDLDFKPIDDVYSENTYLVANREAMIFNFHYVRNLSEQKNDSVIKINIWKDTQLMEFFVNNLDVRVNVHGSRYFDESGNFVRFVLTGECSTLYIHNGYAVIE